MKMIKNTAYAQYLIHVGQAQSVEQLIDTLMEYGQSITTPEMLEDVLMMDEASLGEWHQGLARETNGEENSDEWYDKYELLLIPPCFGRLIQFMELNGEDQAYGDTSGGADPGDADAYA